MQTPIKAYHFFGDTLRDGSPVPPDGEWLRVDPDRIELCSHGLHASLDPFDALQYAPGPNLAIVELSGRVVQGDDKLVASERRIIARIDATDLLRTFARQCALDVIDMWDAPAVVRQYLETGDESLRKAARAAVRDAARAAARDAVVRDAVRDAARDAARAAAWAAAWASEAASRAAARAAFWRRARTEFVRLLRECRPVLDATPTLPKDPAFVRYYAQVRGEAPRAVSG
jgi:hypothetical protein